jgi:hypothetical protein
MSTWGVHRDLEYRVFMTAVQVAAAAVGLALA